MKGEDRDIRDGVNEGFMGPERYERTVVRPEKSTAAHAPCG